MNKARTFALIITMLTACSSPPVVVQANEPLVEEQPEQPTPEFDRDAVSELLRECARVCHLYFTSEQKYSPPDGAHPWHEGTDEVGQYKSHGMPVPFAEYVFPGGMSYRWSSRDDNEDVPFRDAVRERFKELGALAGTFIRYETGPDASMGSRASCALLTMSGNPIAEIDISVSETTQEVIVGEVIFLDE